MRELKQVPIIPNGLRYWVLPDKKPETTIQVGDVILSGGAESKEPPIQGRIVAVGDAQKITPQRIGGGKKAVEYNVLSTGCKYQRGELVIFGNYAGNPHKFEGVDYTILHEDEILGRVIETPFDVDDPTDLTQQ